MKGKKSTRKEPKPKVSKTAQKAIQKKLSSPIGTKVGPNVVKDVYDSATPPKVLANPLGKKK